MSYQHIKDLMTLINQSDLQFVSLQTTDFKLTVSKRETADYMLTQDMAQQTIDATIMPETIGESSNYNASDIQVNPCYKQEQVQASDDLVEIVSPLVGIAYLAPNPQAEPFVKVGDYVKKDQVVCIIEAMKIMNEIKSDVEGIVEDILIDNESVVEFSQILLKIKERK